MTKVLSYIFILIALILIVGVISSVLVNSEIGEKEVVWVADYGNKQVVKLSDSGKELLRINLDIAPVMVKVNPTDGTVWVGAFNFIIKLSPKGEELFRVGGIEELDFSDSISVNPNDGTLWVSSAPNEVIKLSSNGSKLLSVTGFNDSFGVAVDPRDGSVWVADFAGNVVKFSSEGVELVRVFTSNTTGILAEAIAVNPSDGSVWAGAANWERATRNGQVVKLASDGIELLRVDGFSDVIIISINPTDGSVWLTQPSNNQVIKLSSDGKELLRVGGFNSPDDISVNPNDGTLWVADNRNNQIVKLSPNGKELLRLDGFNLPTGVSVNPTPSKELLECIDGTMDEQCSVTKPLYCENDVLINNCKKCGCPAGQRCHKPKGSCRISGNPNLLFILIILIGIFIAFYLSKLYFKNHIK